MNPTWVTYALLGYFVMGIVVSLVVALKRRNARQANQELNPLFYLADPLLGGWLLFLFWPAWLLIMVVDRKCADKAAPQEYLTDEVIGKTGIVVLEPKPVGRVKVEDKLYDATSTQRPLPVGTTIVVTGSKLGELVVERV